MRRVRTHPPMTGQNFPFFIQCARCSACARWLLKEQFQLGLFENPYNDPAVPVASVGRPEL